MARFSLLFRTLILLFASTSLVIFTSTSATAQDLSDLTVGDHNICAIDSDGRLECTTRFTPGIYLPQQDDTLYIDVSSGTAHSCAITQAGDIRCWGLANNRRLEAPTTEVGFVSLDAAEAHTCAVDANTQVHCWGLNTNGQLEVPEPNSGFLSVHTSAVASCGLKESGETVCWTTEPNISSNIPDTPNFIDAVMGNGGAHVQSCGLAADGFIECWATGRFPVDVPTNGPYTQIDANSSLFCGLRTDGVLECNDRTADSSASRQILFSALLEEVNALPRLSSFELTRFFAVDRFNGANAVPSICGITLEGAPVCAGNVLPANTLPFVRATDTTLASALPPIENFRFVAYSPTRLELFWNVALGEGSGNVVGHNIYRNDELFTFTNNNASYVVDEDDFAVGLQLTFSVARVDASGNEGIRSESIIVGTENRDTGEAGAIFDAPVSHPTEPANLSITRYGDSALEVFWEGQPRFFNVRRYQVWSNGDFITTVPGPSYFDDDVNPNTEYDYTIVVVDDRLENIGVGFVTERALNQEQSCSAF